MSPKTPDFDDFSRWLSDRLRTPGIRPDRYDTRLAAQLARSEFLHGRRAQRVIPARDQAASRRATLEVLKLLAAADGQGESRPPEMTTAHGYGVTFAHDDGGAPDCRSIGVLVRSPLESIADVAGETVYLWSGAQRFEIGDFDGEGKAIGTLPAGIEISLLDLAGGRVKIELPPLTGHNIFHQETPGRR